MLIKRFSLVLFALFLASANAFAALIANGDGTVTDTDLGIMWTADPHLTGSTSLTWQQANAWAEGLAFAGFDDWRLPGGTAPNADPAATTPDGIFHYNTLGNELGHLFYSELGGSAGLPITQVFQSSLPFAIVDNPDPDLALFGTILLAPSSPGNIFWTSIASNLSLATPCNNPLDMRWTVSFQIGAAVPQDACADATVRISAWAVRDLNGDQNGNGDNGGTGSVPEPSGLALLAFGLLALTIRRRKA